MSALEFISTTIGQLIWPAVAVAVAFLLREPLRSLGASSRISTIEAGPDGITIAFEEILESAEHAALADAEETSREVTAEVPAAPDELDVGDFRREMRALAAVSPRSAVMESHARVATLLRSTITTAAVKVPDRPMSMRELTRAAVGSGRLAPREAEILYHLADLRNLVAHEPDTTIPREDALRYVDLAGRAAAAVDHGCRALEPSMAGG